MRIKVTSASQHHVFKTPATQTRQQRFRQRIKFQAQHHSHASIEHMRSSQGRHRTPGDSEARQWNLAIVLAGYVVVTIADSFAANEIATRMRISNAKGIFTQDFIIRGGRQFPLYSRVVEACSCKAIVVPALEKEIGVQLRNQDLSWNDFISSTSSLMRPFDYSPVYQPSHATTNILFSSGTTGDPKAIPWTQLSPIKSASEAWAHIDMQSKDIFTRAERMRTQSTGSDGEPNILHQYHQLQSGNASGSANCLL